MFPVYPLRYEAAVYTGAERGKLWSESRRHDIGTVYSYPYTISSINKKHGYLVSDEKEDVLKGGDPSDNALG